MNFSISNNSLYFYDNQAWVCIEKKCRKFRWIVVKVHKTHRKKLATNSCGCSEINFFWKTYTDFRKEISFFTYSQQFLQKVVTAFNVSAAKNNFFTS